MRRFDRATRAIVTIVVGALLAGGSLAPVARAVTPDPSDVVLVFDFSASILKDAATRNRFATALEAIADRVDATTADLTASDATMSIVQFASNAADYPGCVDLKLLNSPETVAQLRGLPAIGRAARTGRGSIRRSPRRSGSTRTTWRRWNRPPSTCRPTRSGRR